MANLSQDERSLAFHVIVGLGNPGEEYQETRHNAGFMVIDALAEELGARYWKGSCGSLVACCTYKGEELVLAKPQSYMNKSGGPVKRLCKQFDCTPSELLVIHDDLDLPEFSFRFKSGGGHGGHNGLRSIHEKLETNEYQRLRIGIGRPPGAMDPAVYVLKPLRKDALEQFKVTVNEARDAALYALVGGVDQAMQRYNGKAASGGDNKDK